jgi:hypothetical protein
MTQTNGRLLLDLFNGALSAVLSKGAAIMEGELVRM